MKACITRLKPKQCKNYRVLIALPKVHSIAFFQGKQQLIFLVTPARQNIKSFSVCKRVRPLLSSRTREFKKLQRQLQRKHDHKMELKLSLLQLFHVGHHVQKRRSALSLAWHEWFSCKGKERKIYCCELALSSKLQILKYFDSRRRLADYVKTLHQISCRTCSTIIFLHSTNQIIDLWRCR